MVHGPWHHPRISRALTHIIMLNQSVEHVECCRNLGWHMSKQSGCVATRTISRPSKLSWAQVQWLLPQSRPSPLIMRKILRKHRSHKEHCTFMEKKVLMAGQCNHDMQSLTVHCDCDWTFYIKSSQFTSKPPPPNHQMIKSPSPRPAELHSSQVTSAAQKRSANQTAKVSPDSPKCPFWLPNVLMSLHVDPATAKRKRPWLADLANCLALPWLSDTMQNRTRNCVHTLLILRLILTLQPFVILPLILWLTTQDCCW